MESLAHEIPDTLDSLVGLLNDKKAEDVQLLNLEGTSSYFSHVLIATALSPLHVKNLANESIRLMRKLGEEVLGFNTKEYDTGWAVLDFGYLVLHLFSREMREKYALDELYANCS